MTTVAKVISPGPQTTVQDAGRTGLRHLGVPQSGAVDRVSFALTNASVGNHWDAPALECALGGLALEFTLKSAFALGGADMTATLNGAPVPQYQQCPVQPGDKLALNQARIGLNGYVAIEGGVAGADFLGGVSTHLPARLGGIEGRALRSGDVITNNGSPGTPTEISAHLRPSLSHDWFLRAISGPEFDLFDAAAQQRFFSSSFTADRRGDRMGVRLNGDPMTAPGTPSMKSSAVFPGTVQCPPDGAPFVLLSDAQTLGGYPRIAQVIDADLPLAGQIRPGDRIWFREIAPKAARLITAQRISYYSDIVKGFRFI
ncbi:MAG: biotin-dependent carboxyltransferase family protein [Pseudomonadota bacterium]